MHIVSRAKTSLVNSDYTPAENTKQQSYLKYYYSQESNVGFLSLFALRLSRTPLRPYLLVASCPAGDDAQGPTLAYGSAEARKNVFVCCIGKVDMLKSLFSPPKVEVGDLTRRVIASQCTMATAAKGAQFHVGALREARAPTST
jgi:hypothetical protein